MHAADRPEFMPPPEPGLLRSIALAVLAHVVLVLALSWGLRWKQDDNRISVEAEIWSSAVQQAAPKPVETAPAPPPPPPPAPKVEQPKVEEPPTPTPEQREAEIAIEREKQRQAQDKARREEAERQRELAEKKEAERQRQLAEKKRLEEQQKKQELARKAEEKKREEQAQAKRKLEDEQRMAKLREENLKRIQGLAGATGAPTATGTAPRAAGPSDSYAGRIRARVKPNIVFTDDVPGNPMAVVEVRLAPDGTIIGKRITKASGIKSWDDAVMRALDRTEVLPRDVDGRVHTPMEIVFRPRD
jgi:colicin import membrane protein